MKRNFFPPSKAMKNINELYHLCLHVKDAKEDAGESLKNLRNWLALKQSTSSSESSTKLIRAAATYRGYDNMTPLHLVLGRAVPIDVVEMLIQLAPETLRMKNSNGKLPLHLACLFGTSLEILDLLITNYPQGLEARDNNDRKPSCFLSMNDYYSSTDSTSKNQQKMKQFLLHKATSGGFSVYLVKLLLQAFPESCIKQDKYGMIPLHYACSFVKTNSTKDSMDTISLLLEANPDSYSVKDCMGRNASAVLLESAVNHHTGAKITISSATSNIYLLHRCAGKTHHTTTGSIHLLRFLLHTYPDSAQTPDHYGMLPFHHACLNPNASLDVLMLFLSSYPNCVATSSF